MNGIRLRWIRMGVLTGVVLVHAAFAIPLFLSQHAAAVPMQVAAPLMVSFITEPAPQPVVVPPPPEPEPPKPQLLAAETRKPEPAVVVAPKPKPKPKPQPPKVEPAPVVKVTPVPIAAAGAPSAPMAARPADHEQGGIAAVAPRFDMAYLENPAPVYPLAAKRRHHEGTVKLRVRVSREGKPLVVQIEESSGHASLDDAAVETVRRWRFMPAKQGSHAVEGWAIVPVEFNLRKRSS